MTDKRPQPPQTQTLRFPAAEPVRESAPESAIDPRTAPTAPPTRVAYELDEDEREDRPYNPFETINKPISPKERAALLALPTPGLNPDDFMNTSQLRVARAKRFAMRVVRAPIAGAAAVVLLLFVFGWALGRSDDDVNSPENPASQSSPPGVTTQPAEPRPMIERAADANPTPRSERARSTAPVSEASSDAQNTSQGKTGPVRAPAKANTTILHSAKISRPTSGLTEGSSESPAATTPPPTAPSLRVAPRPSSTTLDFTQPLMPKSDRTRSQEER